MKKLQLTTLFLATTLVASACGNSNGNNETAGSPTSSAPAATTPASGSASAPGASGSEPFTLKVSYWADNKNGYYEEVAKRFKEKYPNGTVEFNQHPGDKYNELMNTRLPAGEADDVLFNMNMTAYAKAGYLMDLSSQPWIARMNDSAKTAAQFEGKTYGAFLEVNTFGVFYNKKIFEEQQLVPPTTWDEFLSLNEKLKAQKITPIVEGFKDIWTLQAAYIPIAISTYFGTNPNFERDVYDGKASVNGPEVTGALTQFAELADKGYFNKNSLSIGNDQALQDFIDGKAAMHMMGSWTPGVIDGKTQNFPLGFFIIPAKDGNTVMSAGTDKGLSINAATEHPEEAIALVQLMLEPDMLELYGKDNALSAFNDVNPVFANPAMSEIQAALQAHPGHRNPGDYFPPSVQDALNTALTKILAGGGVGDSAAELAKLYEKDKSKVNF
ncbi:ABC transporter substrate-binding protein [Cohnella rhizosphaerae]|uniref:Extracellular solute-binding protein n=1 Tax=Cohnella rhizosphaerae TaxID=1457232 RepID=A0A9X4KUL2_9BACL|nr:extracellular solute-binding protein [Cohnella rhizosphaerae]MDG0811008.1 extracellular solute-binding protein [Cohnella rhizosphaerae]